MSGLLTPQEVEQRRQRFFDFSQERFPLKFSPVIGLNSTAVNGEASESNLDEVMNVWRKSRKVTTKSVCPKDGNPVPETSPTQQTISSVLLCSEQTWDDEVLEACSQLGFLRQNQYSVDPHVESMRQSCFQTLRHRIISICEQKNIEPMNSEVFESWIFHRRLLVDIDDETFSDDALLPRGPCEKGDASLIQYFRSQHISQEEASAIAQDIASFSARLCRSLKRVRRLSRPVRMQSGDAEVMSFHVGKKKLLLNASHYQKLKVLFDPTEIVWDNAKLQNFHRHVASLLLRYVSLQDTGMQAACPERFFELLRTRFEVNFECFASPLNTYHGRYCSAFPDVDHCFGSCGSFFQFFPSTGSFQANPPFTEPLIESMQAHIEHLLSRTKLPLSFVVIVPAWKRSPVWRALKKSDWVVKHVFLPQKQHGYCDGAQHRRSNRYKISTCDTSVFFFQNKAGAKRWRCSDDFLQLMRNSFESQHKAELKRAFDERLEAKSKSSSKSSVPRAKKRRV